MSVAQQLKIISEHLFDAVGRERAAAVTLQAGDEPKDIYEWALLAAARLEGLAEQLDPAPAPAPTLTDVDRALAGRSLAGNLDWMASCYEDCLRQEGEAYFDTDETRGMAYMLRCLAESARSLEGMVKPPSRGDGDNVVHFLGLSAARLKRGRPAGGGGAA